WERLQAEIETNTVGDSWKVTSTGTSTVTYSNGENEPIVSEGLVIFKKPDPAPVSANLGVVAGLHPVMGLGLSQLVDCSWTQSGGSPVLKGRNVERGMVTAVFRQDALLELKSLQLSIKPNFLLTYSFEPYQSIGNVRVPTKVRLVVSSGSREFSRSEYTISDVALGVAKLPANQSWFLPGNVFVDERLERPVSYQYSELLKLNGGSTEITAERLLEFSKRKMIRDMYAEPPRNTDRGNSYLIPALVVLIACVAGLGIAIARKKS
ncbi:MAG TPA: hypothetical protein VJ835_12410, partial [Fimbriimonadaceae bacterium]|nr:hypothetical protein [Fimbriimonadaceae bacterium]